MAGRGAHDFAEVDLDVAWAAHVDFALLVEISVDGRQRLAATGRQGFDLLGYDSHAERGVAFAKRGAEFEIAVRALDAHDMNRKGNVLVDVVGVVNQRSGLAGSLAGSAAGAGVASRSSGRRTSTSTWSMKARLCPRSPASATHHARRSTRHAPSWTFL